MTIFSVHACTFDVGKRFDDTDAAIAYVTDLVHTAWRNGADCVMLPEYALLHLALTRDIPFDLEEFANFFRKDIFPQLETSFIATGKTCILGTVPAVTPKGIVNRALIYANGTWQFQDKLALTPWEDKLVAGDVLRIIKMGDVNAAILICLDSEMPDIAHKIKIDGTVDLILVPSATETRAGAARIARCCYARAVELGCAVVTCGLTGSQGDDSFVGSCQGRTGFYIPSQNITKDMPYHQESDVIPSGTETHIYDVDIDLIRRTRQVVGETNPAGIFLSADIEISK